MQGYLSAKGAMRRFGPLLADPRLKMDSSEVAHDGISNGMLVEAMGDLPNLYTGKDFALALRLLQLGSPAVGVGIGGFDMHSGERDGSPLLYTRYARLLAGVRFALANMPDPAGGSMLDSTLVVTTSEFGRAVNTDTTTGFNAADGSDHGSGGAARHQCHVVFGAGITPKILRPTDDANEPTDGVASTHALLTTMAAAVGVPQEALDQVWPAGSPLFPEGAPLWDLWA